MNMENVARGEYEERLKELESTIFVQNLSFELTEPELFEHFKRFGRLKYAKVD